MVKEAVGRALGMCGRGLCGNFVLSAQFSREPKIALKNCLLIFLKKIVKEVDLGSNIANSGLTKELLNSC